MIVGITGGIGTGKTTVADYLSGLGYLVISADQVAREIVEPGSPVLLELSQHFGEEIIKDDGNLNRQLLASIAFSDKEKKAKLDEITHARIIGLMMERGREKLKADPQNIVFMDVPLLFESGMDKLVDKIWVVDAPYDIRIERITKRDGLSVAEIKKRLAHQLTSDKRREMADFVLENGGGKETLYVDVNRALNEMLNEINGD